MGSPTLSTSSSISCATWPSTPLSSIVDWSSPATVLLLLTLFSVSSLILGPAGSSEWLLAASLYFTVSCSLVRLPLASELSSITSYATILIFIYFLIAQLKAERSLHVDCVSVCLCGDNSEPCHWSTRFSGVILTNQIPALMNSHLPLADESLAGRPPSRHVRRPPGHVFICNW